MMNYGGLRKKMPVTFWIMLIGTLAITGVGIPLTSIGFAGFLSKDAIIESAFAGGTSYAFWMLVIAAAFTSFYSWRLMFLTFWGKPRGNKATHAHAHESPTIMLIPLYVLAVGAIFSGMVFYGPFFGDHHKVGEFFHMNAHDAAHVETLGHEAPAAHGTEVVAVGETIVAHNEAGTHAVVEADHAMAGPGEGGAIYMGADNTVLDDAHHSPAWVKVSPFVAMLLGFLLSYQMYIRRPDWPAKLAENQAPLYRFLKNKWYFDEIYDAIFVRPALAIGRFLWRGGDGAVIDGAINGVALGLVPRVTRLINRAQSGYVFHYAFAMVLGITLLMLWVTLAGGAN